MPDFNLEGERIPLFNQAQAVTVFLAAALDALESAKLAAENMDAEQANASLRLIQPAARILMAARHGTKQALAAWQSLEQQLPRVVTLGNPKDEYKRTGPSFRAPAPLCKACGGGRRVFTTTDEKPIGKVISCPRCKGAGVDP